MRTAFVSMRAVLTVRLALPCNCVCRLSSGLAMEEQEGIPDTLASVIGAVFQVQPLPLEFLSATHVMEQALTVGC